MPTMELKSHKRARRANLKLAILQSIQLAGVLGLAAVAPNSIASLAKLGVIPTKRRQESVRIARSRMIRQGLLSLTNGHVALTKRGEHELNRMHLAHGSIFRPKKWDRKWRVLIFDIPNSRKGLRDKTRHSLKVNGFVRLQNSVWVFPYNCEEFVALLKAQLRIVKDMQYLIVDSIENDADLLDIFKLS